jgi:hypothetical protein
VGPCARAYPAPASALGIFLERTGALALGKTRPAVVVRDTPGREHGWDPGDYLSFCRCQTEAVRAIQQEIVKRAILNDSRRGAEKSHSGWRASQFPHIFIGVKIGYEVLNLFRDEGFDLRARGAGWQRGQK